MRVVLPHEKMFPDGDGVACIVARQKPPDTPPMLDELIHRVAVFGGFLGRKGDKDPGTKTLWQGLQRLHDFTLAIEAVIESQTCG